ncbi:MAG: T9SS type A sorting domain-containing protein [Flavobacteriales bacterium]|jgi:hypothetical protein|nr:T9SS type A sorting domain-containing protein [Flavobacteriales bacterium]
MKKKLLIAIVALFTFNNAQAQMPNGSTGPDFTENDINGNSISLYADFLDQGKPVIMDVSATWCGPCWNFHQSHAMKDIYLTYGDGGSEEVGVLFIEGDGSTGLADLQGTGGSTLGDWVTGTPYPILDNAGIANSYQIAYYPTIYGICPDRTVYEIGQGSASDLMQQLITNCGSVTGFNGVVDNAAIDGGSTKICTGQDVTPEATIHNYGTNTINSATVELFETGNPTAIDVNNWTGTLGAGNSATVQFSPLVAVSNATTYEVVVSNPNGNPDNYPTLNEGDFNIEVANNTTEANLTFTITTDQYGSETTWTIKDGSGATLASGGPYADGQAGAVYTENVTLTTNDCFEVTINDSYGDGIFSSGGYSLTDAANTVLFQEVGPAFGSQVIEPFSKSGGFPAPSWDCDAVNGCFDPGTGAGQYTSLAGCNAVCNTTDVTETISNLSIYPNPVKDVLTIEGNYTSVDMFDILGNLILSSEYVKTINVSSLADGVYMLNIKTENGIAVKKITITK